MAITLVGSARIGGTSNGGTVTLTFDVSPSEGDMVLLFVGASRDSVSNGTISNPTTSGYTRIIDYSESQSQSFAVFYKFMGATPDATVTASGNGGGRSATVAASYVLRGVDSAVTDATPTSAGPFVATNDPDSPSITTATNGAWVFSAASVRGNTDITVSYPSGYSGGVHISQVDTVYQSLGVAYKEISIAGAENPPAFTNWSITGSGSSIAYSIAIKPASSPPVIVIPAHPLTFRLHPLRLTR